QYILQNVEVLAVAQQLEGDAPPQSTSQRAAQTLTGATPSQPPRQANVTQPGARTVTLAVAPGEAQKLVLAEDKGRIRLVLRAHGDDSTMKLDDALFGSLDGAAVLQTEPKPL